MNNCNWRPWVMWFFVLSFFAYQFIMRLYPGLVMNDIMQKFSIDATSFGFLSSMYYFGYAGMQIPMAVLLDRYGPRLVVATFASICSLATLVFVYSDHWTLVLGARFFIGVGSAVGFLGTSKVISLFFAQNRYAQMVGWSFSFGLLGALYGGAPIGMLVEQFGFVFVGCTVCAVGFFIAAMIFWVVRTKKQAVTSKNPPLTHTLRTILTSPRILILAVANLMMVGMLEGFADVWGVTYLMKAYEYEKATAASVTSFIFIGMLFGGPILAFIAEKLGNYFAVTALCGFLMSAIFVFILSMAGDLSYPVLCVLMFVTGILCCYQVLVFSIGSKMVPLAMMGVTIAFLNCINMFGGSFFHLIIGALLDSVWSGEMVEGIRSYSALDYSLALMAIPVFSLCGAVLFLAVKPKRARGEHLGLAQKA